MNETLTAFQAIAILVSIIGILTLFWIAFVLVGSFIWFAFLGPDMIEKKRSRFWIISGSIGITFTAVGLVLYRLAFGHF